MKKILLLLTLLFSNSLFAGILIDPYLAYRMGDSKQTYTTGGALEHDSTGHELGLRLGGSYLGFMAGLQYGMGSVENKETAAATGYTLTNGKDKYDTTSVGLFVGFSGIPFFRVWGTYFFNNKWEASATNTTTGITSGDYLKGSGYSLAVGFTGIPFLSLNLEYRMSTIDNVKSGTATYDLPHLTAGKIDVKEILIGVSAPFNLF